MKKILPILGFLVLITIAAGVLHYLTTGKVVITTDNPNNTIVITKTSDNPNSKVFTKQGHKVLSIAAKAGQYIVSVSGNSFATSQVIEIKAHKTVRYSLNPANTTGVEPVLNRNVYGIAADSSHLRFVDFQNQHLYRLDSQNTPQLVSSDQQLRSVEWASPDYGVAQDINGKLYLVDGSSVKALEVSGSITAFSILPSREIIFSKDNAIYSGTPENGFKKIYIGKGIISLIIPGADKFAVVANPDGPTDKGKGIIPNITVLSHGKKLVNKNIESFVGAWSEHDKYLAISTGVGGEILDASLNRVALVPGTSIRNPLWLDDNTLFYSDNDQLWVYNMQARKSQIIANMPLGGTITELKMNANKSYLYLIVSSGGSDTTIKRVGLQNQKIPSFLYQLQSILPLTIGQCSLSLINFTQPTILVQALGLPADQCQQPVQSDLQERGFDLSKLQVRFVTTALSE